MARARTPRRSTRWLTSRCISAASSSEAEAQCYAIQADAWTVQRLGGTAAEGAGVASYILALQPALPSEYQSGACRAGGGLDVAPATAAFPTEQPAIVPPL